MERTIKQTGAPPLLSLGDRTPIAALLSVIVGEALWPQPIRSNMLYQKSKTLHEPFTFVLEQGKNFHNEARDRACNPDRG